MSRHDEILTELGLAPTWHRRARPGFDLAPDALAAPAIPTVAPAAPPVAPGVTAVASPQARAVRIAALEWRDFAADVDACVACALSRTRKKTVPGVGDVRAQWLFVGEAPGAEEDAKGEPFVGQAGKLLDSMLAALGMNRGKSVYIANVLKCRPPANRTPEPGEVDACRPYLDRQIALIAPKVIVALGKTAMTRLLGNESASLGSMRGKVHDYRGRPVVVTYHPAYLLRTLPEKAKAWEDLLFARRAFAG